MSNKTSEHDFYPTVDYCLVPIYCLCLLIGLPGNLLALRYFSKQPPALAIVLFALTAALDAFSIPVICIPTIFTLINGRDPGWYSDITVCTVLGVLYNWISIISVFLLAVLSFSRTHLLLFPVRKQNKIRTYQFMTLYVTMVTLHETVFTIAGKLNFKYTVDEGYCWDGGVTKPWGTYDDVVDMTLLAVPIIPVSISCFITCYTINKSASRSNRKVTDSPVKRNATITIVLYTLVYLLFSLPNFLNYVAWAQAKIRFGTSSPIYGTGFMKYYSWLLTDTLMIVLISTINPLILLARTRRYQLVSVKSDNEPGCKLDSQQCKSVCQPCKSVCQPSKCQSQIQAVAEDQEYKLEGVLSALRKF